MSIIWNHIEETESPSRVDSDAVEPNEARRIAIQLTDSDHCSVERLAFA